MHGRVRAVVGQPVAVGCAGQGELRGEIAALEHVQAEGVHAGCVARGGGRIGCVHGCRSWADVRARVGGRPAAGAARCVRRGRGHRESDQLASKSTFSMLKRSTGRPSTAKCVRTSSGAAANISSSAARAVAVAPMRVTQVSKSLGHGPAIEGHQLEARALQHRRPLGDAVVAHVGGVAHELEGLQEAVEGRGLGRHDVDQEEASSRREYAPRLSERPFGIAEMMRAQSAGHDIEARVFEGKGFGIGAPGLEVCEPELGGALAGLRQHLLGEVDRDDLLGVSCEGVAGVAGAATDVEGATHGLLGEPCLEGIEVGALAMHDAGPRIVLRHGAELLLHGFLLVSSFVRPLRRIGSVRGASGTSWSNGFNL